MARYASSFYSGRASRGFLRRPSRPARSIRVVKLLSGAPIPRQCFLSRACGGGATRKGRSRASSLSRSGGGGLTYRDPIDYHGGYRGPYCACAYNYNGRNVYGEYIMSKYHAGQRPRGWSPWSGRPHGARNGCLDDVWFVRSIVWLRLFVRLLFIIFVVIVEG